MIMHYPLMICGGNCAFTKRQQAFLTCTQAHRTSTLTAVRTTHTFKTKQNKTNKRKQTALETPSPRRSFRFVNENVDIRFCQDRLGTDAVTQMAFLLAQTCCTISSAPPPPCASARLSPLCVSWLHLCKVPISFVCLLDAFVCDSDDSLWTGSHVYRFEWVVRI
jgi:hypothetical protein